MKWSRGKKWFAATVIAGACIGFGVSAWKHNQSQLYDQAMERAEQLRLDGDFEQALEVYKTASDLNPRKIEPYIQLEEVYEELGQPEEAEKMREKQKEFPAS